MFERILGSIFNLHSAMWIFSEDGKKKKRIQILRVELLGHFKKVRELIS